MKSQFLRNLVISASAVVASFSIPVDAQAADDAHVYVTFEANRKETGNIRWGTWLQDGDELVTGTSDRGSQKSTLCGTDDYTLNCVWELTPGSVDGAYYVQNYATKKYLVNLKAYGNTTVSSPVNIWISDYTFGGKTGVQISTGATVSNSNTIDADNCDRLTGVWSNDAGTLFFKKQLDATTPEQLEKLFRGEDERMEIVLAKLDELKALLNRYRYSVPAAEDIVTETIVLVEEMNPEMLLDYVDELDEMLNSSIVEPVEEQILDEIKSNLSKEWTLYQDIQKGYLSSNTASRKNNTVTSFFYQSEIDENAWWTLVPADTEGTFYLRSNKKQFISTPNVNYCQAVDAKPSEGTDGQFTVGLKDGYVVFASVRHSGCALGLDCQNDPVEIMPLTTNPAGYRWQVTFREPAPEPELVKVNFTPQPGSVQSFELVGMSLATDKEYGLTTDTDARISLYKDDELLMKYPASNVVYSQGLGLYVLMVDQTLPGVYRVCVPEGFFVGADLYNEAAEATWTIAATVVEPVAVAVGITPADGKVGSLEKISLTLDTSDDYAVTSDEASRIQLRRDGVLLAEYAPSDVVFDEAADAYVIRAEYTEAGTYELAIPERFFIGETVYNEAAVAEWIIETDPNAIGVVGEDADDADKIVYDLNGRRVTSPSQGVFVVGGKKVMIRR